MLRRPASIVLVLAALACRDGTPGPNPAGPRPVAAVQVRAGRTALRVRDSLPLAAVALDAAGAALADRPITWTSSDPAVVRVSSRGVAHALGPGSATITASADGKSGTVTLAATLAPVRQVAVTPSRVTMLGGTAALSAVLTDSASNVLAGRPVAWASADTTIATVGADGTVLAIRPGETTVVATSEGVRGEATVLVPPPSPAAVVQVRPDSVAVEVGQGWPLTVALLDATGRPTAGGAPVTWASADTTIAVVLENGLVRGVRPGRTTVTARSGDARGVVPVEVFPVTPVGAIALFPETTTVVVGGTITLAPTVTDSLGHRVVGRPLAWGTSDEMRARVVSASPYDAAVTTLAPGTVTVTATRDGKRGTATLRVVPQPTVARLVVAPETVTVVAGRSVVLDAVTTDASGARVFVPVAWRSADSTVAAVGSGFGSVSARLPGATRVVATAGGLSASATVTVVAPVPLPLATVAAGARYACALDPAGAASCWGLGALGVLGDGAPADTVPHPVPARVTGGHTFAALAAGDRHACALDAAGAARCWGRSAEGQLGAGANVPGATCARYGGGQCSAAPLAVAGGLAFRRLAAGREHTCALTAAGEAWCWGDGTAGQLGAGPTAGSAVPAAVEGGRRYSAIAAGALHTCALAEGGAAWCWGSDAAGQTGAPTTENCPTPTGRTAGCARTPRPVAGGLAFTAIAAGGDHTCALDADGAAWCWGANASGELGTGSRQPSDVPRPVAGGLRFAALAAGAAHTCGLAAGGAAYCWGANRTGALGTGASGEPAAVPVRVSAAVAFEALSAGAEHTCGVAARVAYCWGWNDNGQLGTGAVSPPLLRPSLPVTTP